MTNLLFTHTYEATWEADPQTRIAARYVIPFNISLTPQPEFALNHILDENTAFSDDDIEKIDQIFRNQLVDFIKTILDMHPPVPITIFSNIRYIEKDILSLLDRSEDPELQQTLDHLKSTHPSKAKSMYALKRAAHVHAQYITNYITQKIAPTISFQNNMHRLYLSIALDYKAQKSHWLYKKKTYAQLSTTLLKIPILLLQITWIFLMTTISALFIMTPFIIACGFLSAEISLMTASAVMVLWLFVLALLLKTNLFMACFGAAQYAANSAAYWVDRGIQALFHVEFFAFKLSETLAKMNENGELDSYIGVLWKNPQKWAF